MAFDAAEIIFEGDVLVRRGRSHRADPSRADAELLKVVMHLRDERNRARPRMKNGFLPKPFFQAGWLQKIGRDTGRPRFSGAKTSKLQMHGLRRSFRQLSRRAWRFCEILIGTARGELATLLRG